jgi:hypothetical protein
LLACLLCLLALLGWVEQLRKKTKKKSNDSVGCVLFNAHSEKAVCAV